MIFMEQLDFYSLICGCKGRVSYGDTVFRRKNKKKKKRT